MIDEGGVAPAPDRVDRERGFHDEVFASHKRRRLARYYRTADLSRSIYRDRVHARAAGMRILELGCGAGSQALSLAKAGATATAIDISEVAIAQAEQKAGRDGVTVDFRVMSAEELGFADDRFDRICGSGILHHLDLERGFAELRRVLRPGGSAIFFEPMGYNPLINLYRRLTPDLRTDDEHPLVVEDFEVARRYFDEVTPSHFHLTSIAASLARGPALQSALLRPLNRLDSLLFRLPLLRKCAWIVLLELR